MIADQEGIPPLGEAGCPGGVRGNEHRHAVDEADTGLEGLLGVELGGPLGTDGQVVDEDLRLRVPEDLGDVDGGRRRLDDLLAVVAAEAVQRRPPGHDDAGLRHLGELDGVVVAGLQGLGQVDTDLVGVHVEGARDLDVGDVVAAEACVHQAGDVRAVAGVSVELHPLDESRGAVASSHESNPDALHHDRALLVVGSLKAAWSGPVRRRPPSSLLR